MKQKTLFDLETVSKKVTPYEMSFAEYMKEHHVGRHQAIISKRLRHFGSGVEIREIVHSLRVVGVPICSDSTGYYYAENSADVYATVSNLKSRITQIEKAHGGLLDTYYEMKTDEKIK